MDFQDATEMSKFLTDYWMRLSSKPEVRRVERQSGCQKSDRGLEDAS